MNFEESDKHLKMKETPAASSVTTAVPSISPISTDMPALPTAVHLGLTITYTLLYSFLFLFVYVQLILILWYRHKRFSYQSTFLFLCLIWAALRTTLFSFYFKNPILANNLPTFPFWLLYCFPICLQFVTLCLLVLYFSQVVFNAKTKYEPSNFRRFLRVALGCAVLMFITTNVACAIISKQNNSKTIQPNEVITTRVMINELLFLACGISLAVCVYKLTKMTSAKLILETKGTTVCKTSAVCMITILLYISRASYNIVVVFLSRSTGAPSFNFGWINITDQAQIEGFTYATFGVVLFIWEFLPTFVVVLFFRVRQPIATLVVTDSSNNSHPSRAYFFDNPRRYDSDEELFKSSTASHDSPGRNANQAARNIRYPSPYGSFHSSYVFHHGSLGHSSVEGSVSTTAGSQPENSYTQPNTLNPIVIPAISNQQYFSGQSLRDTRLPLPSTS